MSKRIQHYLAVTVFCILAGSAHGDEVLLQRGTVQVTAADVERYIRERVPAEARDAFMGKPNSLRDVTENIYVIRSLAAEAEGVKDLDHEQITWQAEFQRQRLMMNALLAHVAETRLADQDWDAAAREVYTAEREKFQIEEQVRVSHILVKTDSRSDEEGLALAASLRERVRKGEDFAELAKAHSEDPSAQKNAGDLGFFRRGQMVAPFEEAAFAMREPGAISEPVKTQFGYHLIRFQERREARQRSFEEVKEEIITGLRQKISNHARQTEITRVRSAADIVWNQELMDQLEQRLRTKGE